MAKVTYESSPHFDPKHCSRKKTEVFNSHAVQLAQENNVYSEFACDKDSVGTCDIILKGCNIVPTFEPCVGLKIIVGNCLV